MARQVGVGGRQVGVEAGQLHGSVTQGPIGFPIHIVLSGTDSPLITSDTGPTVA